MFTAYVRAILLAFEPSQLEECVMGDPSLAGLLPAYPVRTKTWSQNLAACRCSWLKRL